MKVKMAPRVLLVFPTLIFSQKKDFALPPLGILYLAGYLKKKQPDASIRLIDLETTTWDIDTSISSILNFKPDVVGISVMTPYLINTMRLVQGIKEKNSSIKIVLGGPHITATGNELFSLQYRFLPDYLVFGEGEESFFDIVDNLNDDNKEIEGVSHLMSNGRVIGNPKVRRHINDLDSLPIIDFGFLDVSNYTSVQSKSPYTVSLMASRGCPYNCSFCDVSTTQGKRLRLKSPEYIVKEIELNAKKYRISDYYFKDSTFTINRDWVMRICELLIVRRLKITWSCNTRPELLDNELLAMMHKAGCKLIAFGFESTDIEVLQAMNKKVSPETYKDTINKCRRNGIMVYGFFMVGNCGEKKEDAQKTLDFAMKEDIAWASFSPVVAYPGTALYWEAIRTGVLKNAKWYVNTQGESFVSQIIGAGGLEQPNFSIHDQTEFVKMANKAFYLRLRWILKMFPFFIDIGYVRKIAPFVLKFLVFVFRKNS